MLVSVLWLIASLAIILIGAEAFTNGVEWLGKKLNLGAGAVGSVLAAVGTALPETLIPVIAIIGGSTDSHDVGIGAILGAPFMLVTLAMFLTGLSAMVVHRKKKVRKGLDIQAAVMRRDIGFFIVVYAVAILASFMPPSAKIPVAVLLIGAYVFYVFQTIKSSVGQHDESHRINPFYLMRSNVNPSLGIVLLQIMAALGVIILGATLFVDKVVVVAKALGMPALLLSLVITPIATELPEKFNSIIWITRGQDTLALGNITGAMVFQSSLIPALGILMTPWQLEPMALLSAVLALLAAVWLFICLRRTQTLTPGQAMVCGTLYAVFIAFVLGGWI